MFKAIVIDKQDGTQSVRIADLDDAQLPDAPVTVRVEYSTVNYKDGLAITGKSPVVRKFPMVPGIDMAGIVEASTSETWRPGDRVLLNGWGVGEGHWGGFSQKARVKAEWLQRVPEELHHSSGDGHWYRRIYREPLRRRAGAPRVDARSGGCAGHRRLGRRRQRRHRAAGRRRLQGHRIHRQSG